MNKCENCGKQTNRLYGMSDGRFFCKECADVPRLVKPDIDVRPWQIKTFTTKRPDKDFDDRVNDFLRTIGNCIVESNITYSKDDTFCLVITYREQ